MSTPTRVTIIPASGKATRIGGLPKFLLPMPPEEGIAVPERGFFSLLDFHIGYGLEFSELILLASRPENATLLEPYLQPGRVELLSMATDTMTETVMRATATCPCDETLVLMPDTFFESEFSPSTMKLNSDEILSVGAWGVSPSQVGSVGQIGLVADGVGHRVVSHEDKSENSKLPWVWGAMNLGRTAIARLDRDFPHIGYVLTEVLQDAESRLKIGARTFTGQYIDCGTPAGYFRAVQARLDSGGSRLK